MPDPTSPSGGINLGHALGEVQRLINQVQPVLPVLGGLIGNNSQLPATALSTTPGVTQSATGIPVSLSASPETQKMLTWILIGLGILIVGLILAVML